MFHIATLVWFSLLVAILAVISFLIAREEDGDRQRAKVYHTALAILLAVAFLVTGLVHLEGHGGPFMTEYIALFAIAGAIELVRVGEEFLKEEG